MSSRSRKHLPKGDNRSIKHGLSSTKSQEMEEAATPTDWVWNELNRAWSRLGANGNWEVIYKDDLNQEQTPQPQIASLPSQSASQYKPNPDHQIGFLNPETSRLPYANDYASIAPQPLSIARASGTDYEYNKSIITSTPLTATEAPRQSLAAQGDSSKGDLYSYQETRNNFQKSQRGIWPEDNDGDRSETDKSEGETNGNASQVTDPPMTYPYPPVYPDPRGLSVNYSQTLQRPDVLEGNREGIMPSASPGLRSMSGGPSFAGIQDPTFRTRPDDVSQLSSTMQSLGVHDSDEEDSDEPSTERTTKPPPLLDEGGTTREASVTPSTRGGQGQRAPRPFDPRQGGGRTREDETCSCGRGCRPGEGCRIGSGWQERRNDQKKCKCGRRCRAGHGCLKPKRR